jgi:transglutaminase-like putative cysteine protease
MIRAHAMQEAPRTPLLWVCSALAAAVLLHAIQVPAWITLAALALIGWRLAALRGAARLPGGIVRIALGLALVAAVFAQFHTLNGLVPGTAMLMLMMAIKLLETRRRRDQYVVIGGALFLLLAACLDRQDLTWVPLYGVEALLCFSALAVVAYAPGWEDGQPPPLMPRPAHMPMPVPVPVAAPAGLRTREIIVLAGRTLLYSLPLAILMFLFFPRLPGHLWALPAGEDAVTGLGDTLTPGSITFLTSSYAIAFRARFDGRPPPPEERYWRGPVMHDFDGATWKAGQYAAGGAQRLDCLSTPYRYRIYLQPTFRHWWLALDTVMGPPVPGVQYTGDYQLIASRPVSQSLSYRAASCADPRALAPLSSAARAEDTQLPAARNPDTRALAVRLRRRAGSDVAFVQAVLAFLRKGGFSYSLTPPPLGPDPVDDFLFHTRTGFCGHYASAFVDIMRAGGVPARVVTGYLGGEWNPYDATIIVRQSDAHAWAEVWLAGTGWTRVDPTAVVAPERLHRGILDLLPDAVSAPARLVHAWPWLNTTLERWEALNGWWNERVVGFNYRAQLDLLRNLGLRSPDLRDAGWAFTAALLTWLAWIGWQLGREPRPAPPDRLGRAYNRLCRKLARRGLPRAPHQGPLAYAQSIATHRPDLTARVRPLLEQYAALRFGLSPSPSPPSHSPPPQHSSHEQALRSFERSVSRLSIPRPQHRGRPNPLHSQAR